MDFLFDIEKKNKKYIKINLGSSSNGEFTLRPVLSTSSYSASFAIGNDPSVLFNEFATTGEVSQYMVVMVLTQMMH